MARKRGTSRRKPRGGYRGPSAAERGVKADRERQRWQSLLARVSLIESFLESRGPFVGPDTEEE